METATVEPETEGFPIVAYILLVVATTIAAGCTHFLGSVAMYYPVNSIGWDIWTHKSSPIGLFSFKGIVPTFASKIARSVASQILKHSINMSQLLAGMDPKKMNEGMEEYEMENNYETMDVFGAKAFPQMWPLLSVPLKRDMARTIKGNNVLLITLLVNDMQANLGNLMDIGNLVTQKAERQPSIMNEFFHEVGGKEFKLMKLFGPLIGLLNGICMAALLYASFSWPQPAWWVVPVSGFVIGAILDYLLLHFLMEPATPIDLGFMKIQGSFPARQQEAAAAMTRMLCKHYLTIDLLMKEIIYGADPEVFRRLVKRVVSRYMAVGQTTADALFFYTILSEEQRQILEDEMTTTVIKQMDQGVAEGKQGAEVQSRLNMYDQLFVPMSQLSPQVFNTTFKPAIDSIKWYLIWLVAITQALTGLCCYFVFDRMVRDGAI